MLAWEEILITVAAIVAFVAIGLLLAGMILYTRAKLVSSQACKLFINEDPEMTKETPSGVTLLSALTENGIAVPSPCGGKATCKQCRVQVLEGGGLPLQTEKSTFTQKELKEGWRLSCQCKIKEDVLVHVPHELLSVKEWTGKVISNNNVATFIKELVVEVPEEIPYRSGGYLQIHVPPFQTNTGEWKETMDPIYYTDWERFKLFDREVNFSDLPGEVIRAYSMASYPAEGRKLMFNIRIASPPFLNGEPNPNIPWGICSSYTFGLKPGDSVRLSGPYGESFMVNDARELVFLIGGAGSSFGRSHIMHLFRSEKTKRKVTLWYGARSLKENIYQEEYEQLAKDFQNFSYHLVLSEPAPEDLNGGWPKQDPTKTNFLFKAFEVGQLQKMEEPEEALYYVCGPPLHNQSVMKLLDDYGVARQSIILDDFGS
ncbi:MAG: NADH:ubiquinone reductase (Na(+)-transporting) subunit F [Verrucomicrobia bacterium]|nr:NADH:ubiquinone reductase (Na(+)-transporting) subunit F [Verrucomicrobiota bacterium]